MRRSLRLWWVRRLLARANRLERQTERRINRHRDVIRMIDAHLAALAREDAA